jgi:hypothetical protein
MPATVISAPSTDIAGRPHLVSRLGSRAVGRSPDTCHVHEPDRGAKDYLQKIAHAAPREHLDRREEHTVSTTDPQQPATKQPPIPSLEDIFGNSEPLRSSEDLAQDGIFSDGEVDEFIADLYAMRRSDVA